MLGASLPVLTGALAFEIILGDPVSRWHPVALFGRGMEKLFSLATNPQPPTPNPQLRARQLTYGVVLTVGAALLVALAAGLLLRGLGAAGPWPAALVGAVLLKLSLSYRQLETEALRVATEVERAELDAARSSAQALVSRPADDLSAEALVSAAVESMAENLSDSFVAPLFYYVCLGVPGALAYRAINTLDAMVGYHGPLEYLGKAAAKLDDVANWVPARLTTLLMVIGAALAGANSGSAWKVAWRDHSRTESPNAGWPMATMAGALDVRLEKAGQYVLGDANRELTPARVAEAVAIARRGAILATVLALGAAAA